MSNTDINIDVTGIMETTTIDLKTIKYFNLFHTGIPIPDSKKWLQEQKQNVRPWLIFLQTTNFKTPPSISRLSKRIMRNIEYFQSNYLFVFFGLIIYCLITSPLILIALSINLLIGYKLNQRHLNNQKFQIFGKELTIAQQYGILILSFLPFYYWIGMHGAIFWIIGVSFIVILLHASFYNIDLIINTDNINLLEDV